MADFIEVGRTNDLNDGTMKRIYLDGNEILLARVEGKPMAGFCSIMGLQQKHPTTTYVPPSCVWMTLYT
jgi:hypothetical protein